MKIKIDLNEHDLAKILESYYSSKDISLYVQQEIEGSGLTERAVPKIHAEIVINTDSDPFHY